MGKCPLLTDDVLFVNLKYKKEIHISGKSACLYVTQGQLSLCQALYIQGNEKMLRLCPFSTGCVSYCT